jgi:hypothetical protein
MRTETLETLGADETGARARITAAGGRVAYRSDPPRIIVTWPDGNTSTAAGVLGKSIRTAAYWGVARSNGDAAKAKLSQSAVTILFNLIFDAWQAGKISDADFAAALDLILDGQDPGSKTFEVAGKVKEALRAKQRREIRDYVGQLFRQRLALN